MSNGEGNILRTTPALALFVFIVAASTCLFAAPPRQVPVPPPPMGWSSWNSFSNTVDSTVIQQQARAMVENGMQKAGYRYINIDEGWWLGKRDRNGNILVDPKQWPALKPGERAGDMSNIIRYIHSLGLKAGIYTDAGENGCGFYSPDIGPPAPGTGSENHYDQDFLQFAKWGFDYVKVDWCGGSRENLDPAVQDAAIAHAIERAEQSTGHPLYYSLCNWGKQSPWTWAPGVGGITADIWRVSGDIVNPIVANTIRADGKASFQNMLRNFDQGIHPQAQHTGFYNDPDMMVIGMPGFSETWNRVHMSLWAISGAPLIVGADLTKLDPATLQILTNPAVVAVDQDSLGLQGILAAQPAPGLQLWSKRLAQDGEYAVVLLNRTNAPASIPVTWKKLGLEPASAATVRDLWGRKDLGTYKSGYSPTVQAGDAAMLIVHGQPAKGLHVDVSSPAVELGGGASVEHCAFCPGGNQVTLGEERTTTFNVPGGRAQTYLDIFYLNPAKQPRIAQLEVNGRVATKIAFPPTKNGSVGSIVIEANLKSDGNANRLRFAAPALRVSDGLALVAISLSGNGGADNPSASQ